MTLRKPTDAERCELARQAYDAAFDAFESFNDEKVGADLAYLMGAIVSGNFVDWTAKGYGDSPPVLLGALRRAFSADSPIWQFVIAD